MTVNRQTVRYEFQSKWKARKFSDDVDIVCNAACADIQAYVDGSYQVTIYQTRVALPWSRIAAIYSNQR